MKNILYTLLFIPLFGFSLEVPSLTGPVVDMAGILNYSEKEVISASIRDYYKQTGNQFQILTLKSLEGESIEGFSINVAEKWKIGGEKGTGVIILIATGDRKMRIEVGNGLEGELPDVLCGRIITQLMAPQFRNGNYGAGLAQALSFMSARLGTKMTFSNAKLMRGSNRYRRKRKTGFSFILFLIFFFTITRFLGARGTGGFLTGMFLGSMLGGGRGGSSGGFSSGGWSGGGGGFSGGGASGGW